ncbi:MAG: hypothetical protein U0872_07310 [Planctomycetaceae bacterium]
MANSREVRPVPPSEGLANRRTAIIAIGAMGVLAVCLVLWSRLPPPLLGDDDDVVRTVDALFTALTSRNSTWIDDCEQRLHLLRDESRLPAASARFLDDTIAQAREGRWEPAAKRLYDFILRQRART